MQKGGPNWNTGLLGCLALPTTTIFDVGGVPTGFIPPLLFWKNRTIILNGNEGEKLYCLPSSCGSKGHALVYTFGYCLCPPIIGGLQRSRIRNSFGIPGSIAVDMLLHAVLCPLALAQEYRHLKVEGFKGRSTLETPRWRMWLRTLCPFSGIEAELQQAAQEGDASRIKKLVEAGARVNVTDATKSSPLHYAAYYGHADACLALLAAGARLDQPDVLGATAVMKASRAGHNAIVQMLWEEGGHLQTRDASGFSVVDYMRVPPKDFQPTANFTYAVTQAKPGRLPPQAAMPAGAAAAAPRA